MTEENQTPLQEQPKGFSWLGCFFHGFYYAGYGDLKKAAILLTIVGLIPGAALFVSIYTGFKAKKDLPVGQQPFDWKKCLGAVAVFWVITSIYFSILTNALFGVPDCDSDDAENLLNQIVQNQLRIQILSLNDIEEIAYNEKSRIRICTATAVTSRVTEQIEYSISRTSDNDIYVEIR